MQSSLARRGWLSAVASQPIGGFLLTTLLVFGNVEPYAFLGSCPWGTRVEGAFLSAASWVVPQVSRNAMSS